MPRLFWATNCPWCPIDAAAVVRKLKRIVVTGPAAVDAAACAAHGITVRRLPAGGLQALIGLLETLVEEAPQMPR